MTGVQSYSTTPAENVNANTGITWDEGMSPALVNNSARQNMTDVRLQWNDASWFQYGAGSKTVAATYSSATAFTLTGADATAYWHAGRRVKAVGSGTGTIYGKVASSSYGAGATTVNVTWDSGSLSNEALTIYASTIPVTGSPIPQLTITEGTATSVSVSSSLTQLTSLALTPGKWRLSASVVENGGSAGDDQCMFSTTTASSSGATFGKSWVQFAVSSNGRGGAAIAPFDITITANTTYYLNGSSTCTTPVMSAYARAEKIYGN